MLRRYLSDLRLEQLPIPMNTITVDLVSGEPKVRDRGDAVDGILESINLPGLSAPICRNGQALVDGGLVNNVPADVLVSKGCNFVIAVSVTAKLEQEFASIRPDSPGPKYRTPSVMQTIMRGYLVQSVNMNSVGIQPADLNIDLDVTNFDLSEFTRTDELAAIGLETTEASIEAIRTSLASLDKELVFTTQRRLSMYFRHVVRILIVFGAGLLATQMAVLGAEHPELKAFPEAKEGMERFVIVLPHKERGEEDAFKVELIPGKTMPTDGVNLMRLGITSNRVL